MAYTIEFNHPDFPKGTEFDLTGVGVVENNGSTKLDADGERDFIARNGQKVKDYFQGNEMVKVSGESELKSEEVKELLPPPEPEAEQPEATQESEGNVEARKTLEEGGES